MRGRNQAPEKRHLVIFFYKIDERDYDILKTFLSYLNIVPEMIYGIRGKNISVTETCIFHNNSALVLLQKS